VDEYNVANLLLTGTMFQPGDKVRVTVDNGRLFRVVTPERWLKLGRMDV